MQTAPDLIHTLREICGSGHVLTGKGATRRYTKGFRTGGGPVTCVARPGSLVEMWRAARPLGRVVMTARSSSST